MNTMSLKEKAVLAMFVVIALYVAAVVVWFVSAESAWKKAAKAYDKAKSTYAAECKTIAKKRQIEENYESAKSEMPTFAAGKATDTTWLRKVGEIAERSRVQIGQLQGGKEIQAGEVSELPIEVKSWEASLQSLVTFMHELENTDEGMFDITNISFKPSSKKGYLKGSMTLACAYMREE